MQRVVVGKWSDLGAVEHRLAELGLSASAEQAAAILRRAMELGLTRKRPLEDAELLELARAEGAIPA